MHFSIYQVRQTTGLKAKLLSFIYLFIYFQTEKTWCTSCTEHNYEISVLQNWSLSELRGVLLLVLQLLSTFWETRISLPVISIKHTVCRSNTTMNSHPHLLYLYIKHLPYLSACSSSLLRSSFFFLALGMILFLADCLSWGVGSLKDTMSSMSSIRESQADGMMAWKKKKQTNKALVSRPLF